ncbi:hypothetical protein BEH94_09820 [Candidatus Altiarchaeales archaeon WOR_SM1_SCG]|nr:hypothetical protein BEH94_09820 [Candidatus Altiarchaeales archaeon WOR_SM1_SCG]
MTQNIEKIKESLNTKKIIGLVIPDAEYDEILIEVAKTLGKNYNKILYISVNRPCESLKSKFKENGTDTDKFYIVDCITRTGKDAPPTKNCFYISSPKALDEIQTAALNFLMRNEIDVALIDSPSSLLIYYEHTEVLQFLHRLMSMLIIAECGGVFPFPKESNESLRRSVEMFTNKIIYL